MANEVEDIFARLGMQQYLSTFLNAGFDNWASLREILETDFLKLSVRRGDRRKIQREIARRQLWPDLRPLPTPADLQLHQQAISRLGSAVSIADSFSRHYSYSPASNELTSLAASPQPLQPSASNLNEQTSSHTDYDVRERILTIFRDRFIMLDAGIQHDNVYSPHSSFQHNLSSSPANYRNAFGESFEPGNSSLRAPEALVDQVCQALSSTAPSPNILSQDQLHHRLYNIQNTSWPFQFSSQLEPHFKAFMERLNHILHLFDEFSLREAFQNAIAGKPIPGESSIDLNLALALGATHTGTQPRSVHLELYLRARVQLSRLKEWSDDLWMMRVLTLISLYHIQMFAGSTSRFLDLAILLGKVNGLDSSSFSLPKVADPKRSHWLRVWKSVEFLQNWRQLKSHDSALEILDTGYLINITEPALRSEECLNGRLTQMNMNVLSSIFKEVNRDIRDSAQAESTTPSLSLFPVHLESLYIFHSGLPIYFCLRPKDEGSSSSRLVDAMNDRQKASILNVHSLYLGIKCQLLEPALVRLVLAPLSTNDSSALFEYARRCVKAARMIIDICDNVLISGFEFKGQWIVL